MRRRIDFGAIRTAMADFELSPKVAPNETIEPDRVFFPAGHRGVLDLKRQLVIGNRGVGKSFWTHALLNEELRQTLARVYGQPRLAKTKVVIGFNGSEKLGPVAPTIEELSAAYSAGHDAELIWRAVLFRATHSVRASGPAPSFQQAVSIVKKQPEAFATALSLADDILSRDGMSLLIVFDALDRLAQDWDSIRGLTKGLLIRTLGLQSFRAIRAKVFMRVDQFSDADLFRFRDSSKITNDYVDMAWRPHELYGLLLFELLRNQQAADQLGTLASQTNAQEALPESGRFNTAALEDLPALITAIAGEFMGGHKKRGRVYSWVPLHLSDAANNCSPRTFLTAWKTAADHVPPPPGDRAVDHLGLIDGVRRASSARLTELHEDYPWIDSALEPLRRQFVPIPREELFALWNKRNVLESILAEARQNHWLAPIDVFIESAPSALLKTMVSIAVMEERANGKINVPDIFRVEAGIMRKGGVAVPRRN